MARSIKVLCSALAAVFACGAFAASQASAQALVKFTANGPFEGTGGSVELEAANKEKVTCKSTAIKGNVTSEDQAHATILFDECTSVVSGFTAECGNEGSANSIHVLAAVLLGSDTAPPEDKPAVLIQPLNSKDEPAPVVFKCEALGLSSTITVEGSVIGLATETAPGAIEISLKKGANAGEQEDTHFWDETESGVENFLEIKAEGVIEYGFQKFAEEATATLTGTEKEIKIET